MKPEESLELITPEKFSIEVERAVHDGLSESFIACIVEKAEEYDLDIESIKPYLTPSLVEKLKHEATSLNLLKERNTTTSLVDLLAG